MAIRDVPMSDYMKSRIAHIEKKRRERMAKKSPTVPFPPEKSIKATLDQKRFIVDLETYGGDWSKLEMSTLRLMQDERNRAFRVLDDPAVRPERMKIPVKPKLPTHPQEHDVVREWTFGWVSLPDGDAPSVYKSRRLTGTMSDALRHHERLSSRGIECYFYDDPALGLFGQFSYRLMKCLERNEVQDLPEETFVRAELTRLKQELLGAA